MARLIRTEKEVEGRYEEVWLVVEEDALEQWPAGPRDDGRRRPRNGRLQRARGEATYTADLRLNGMLHTAVLRSPHPRATVARIDLAPALASRGVHAAVGPGEIPQLVDECNYQGHAVAAVCADTLEQARAALAAIDGRVGRARAAARPRRGGRAAARCSTSRACVRAATTSGASPRPTSSSRASTARGRAAQLDGDAPVGRPVGRRHRRGAHLDAVHLGHPRRRRRPSSAAARQGARDLPLHGRRLRLEERPRRLHVHRGRAREAHRTGRSSAR